MKHIKNDLIPLLEHINQKMLEKKHHKPYKEITFADMDEADCKRFNDILKLGRRWIMNKLTMHELCKRIDAEFYDVDLSVHDSPTKGTVAVVYFYENKLEEVNDES